jgi:hypothetical protein
MPAISSTAKKKITEQISIVVEDYLQRSNDSPAANSGNPFVIAILKDFEPLLHRLHGLKGSMGNQMEKIAEIIAIEAWGKDNVERNVRVDISLPINVFQEINSIMNNLSDVKCHPRYQEEKEKILNACLRPSLKKEIHTYEYDLILFDSSKRNYYCIELKGPDPNTTEVPGAKTRLLTSIAFLYFKYKSKKVDSFIGIYYNNKFPKPYNNPKILNYFDPANDMKVHSDFWNFLGKNKNTYNELLELFETYGKKNKQRIWDGFSKLVIGKN